MTRQLREVAEIVGQSEPPTFDNTFAALERSGQLLTRVLRVFAAVTSANTNDRLQAVQADKAPRLAEHSDSIYLDDGLFARVRNVYDRRDALALTPEQRRLVERYHLDFVRAGARLASPAKARLRELNREEATLTTEFQSRLLEANKAASITVEDVGQLDGLSPEDVASAAQLAAGRGAPEPLGARDPEHDAAAGARVLARPRPPLPAVRSVGPPRGPRRSRRHARNHRSAGGASRRARGTAGVRERRRLRARRSDGEDTGGRDAPPSSGRRARGGKGPPRRRPAAVDDRRVG